MYEVKLTCRTCEGTGETLTDYPVPGIACPDCIDGRLMVECEACEKQGWLPTPDGWETCPDCNGSGRRPATEEDVEAAVRNALRTFQLTVEVLNDVAHGSPPFYGKDSVDYLNERNAAMTTRLQERSSEVIALRKALAAASVAWVMDVLRWEDEQPARSIDHKHSVAGEPAPVKEPNPWLGMPDRFDRCQAQVNADCAWHLGLSMSFQDSVRSGICYLCRPILGVGKPWVEDDTAAPAPVEAWVERMPEHNYGVDHYLSTARAALSKVAQFFPEVTE